MKKCMMTESALEVISIEVSKGKRETGGILIGPPPSASEIVITKATGPGKGKRTITSWETDPDFLNSMLKAARGENSLLNLRGFWHRHPGQMAQPSPQDLSEAVKILQDVEHYHLGGELVMPIVTVTKEGVTIQGYFISAHEPNFVGIPIEVVPDSDEFVNSLLSGRKTIEVKEGGWLDFWQDASWQFYKSRSGVTRLQEEFEKLKLKGYAADAVLLSDGMLCVEVWKGEGLQRALFILPREYPLNPPKIFLKTENEIQAIETDSGLRLWSWSSSCHIVDLMDGPMKEWRVRPRPRLAEKLKQVKEIKEIGIKVVILTVARFLWHGCGDMRILRQLPILRRKGV